MGQTPPHVKNPLTDAIKALQRQAEQALAEADTRQQLDEIRVRFLGKKGELSGILRGLKDIPDEERSLVGALANEVKDYLSGQIDGALERVKAAEINRRISEETIDVTMPGVFRPQGKAHPLTLVMDEMCEVFRGLGFSILDDTLCPEVETEYYNFEALNFPPDHPARDMQDTFYTDIPGSHVLLRSQTSNAQIRYMESHLKAPGVLNEKMPIRIVAPGRVYRNEEVSSRKNVLFHQMEGLLVDDDVYFSDLKGILHAFATAYFGEVRKTRFRASYFPFTEPSAEMDVECHGCRGQGCRICGHHGWLEILGAGMVDPNVLEGVGIDSERYSGFAFGMGVERLAMLKYGIQNIRSFYTNDLRFLRQSKG